MGSMEEDFMKMNSDGYDEQYQKCFRGNLKIHDGAASEFEIPSKLSTTNCDIPMPPVKPPLNNVGHTCNSCDKEDICKYKEEMLHVMKEISQIQERNGLFTISIECDRYSEKNESNNNYIRCPVANGDIYPRCVYLIDRKYCGSKTGCRYRSK